MSMDSSDFTLVKQLRALQQELLEEAQRSNANQEKMLAVFNQIATDMHILVEEVKRTNQELAPKTLNKPRQPL